ncbi:hypothetical protein Pcinc_023728 [Petrolisthes cinctipes]|uniref:Uncharacterized protein n=1 Tax=Petrolisthes cinctipes TaxID=88211 RepID=A0AAE1FDN6_PETCI|nr:hypothetical protein Pcinc_023728 [Petrolisthes cinctipes]
MKVLVPPSLTPMSPMLRATLMQGDTHWVHSTVVLVMWVVGEEQVFDEGEEEGGRWTNRGGAEGEDEGGRMVYEEWRRPEMRKGAFC